MATIAENLVTLSTHLDAAYAALSTLGAEVPQERRAGNLTATIAGIPPKMCGITVPRLKDGHDLGGMLSGNDMVSSISFPELSSCERYTFEEAFKNCTNLKEVNLPNLISTNGDVFKNAFVNSGIEKIDFPKLATGRVGFYTGCTNATKLKSFSLSALPEVTMDGYQFHEALKGCSALTAVNFHSLTTDNGLRNSFYSMVANDRSLVSVDFSSLQYATGKESFGYVFSNTGLVSAEFPSLVQIGGQQTFRGALGWNTELTSASFPELSSVLTSRSGTPTNNGMQAILKGCPKLEQVSFPKLQYLQPKQTMYQAMMDCISLSSIEFPALLSVGEEALREAFSGCTSLTSASFPNLLSVSKKGFLTAFVNCALEEFSLPSLTACQDTAFDGAFQSNQMLTSVSMPNLTSIGNSAFSNSFLSCTSLLSIEIGTNGSLDVPQSMMSFGRTQSPLGITVLKLGDVGTIGALAFQLNTAIGVIDFTLNTSVPVLYNINAFNGVSALTCVIPDALDGTWQEYGNWPTLLANNDQVTIQTQSQYYGEEPPPEEEPSEEEGGNGE